ncbi:MAG: hypothetical protein ACK5SU_07335, partial [Phenylobacterium sp.]
MTPPAALVPEGVRGAGANAVCPPARARDLRFDRCAVRNRGRIPDMASIDSLKTRRELTVGDKTYVYYSLPA